MLIYNRVKIQRRNAKTLFRKAENVLNKVDTKNKDESIDTNVDESVEDMAEEEAEPTGLMARRTPDGI